MSNNVSINGSGTVGGGTYDSVNINGSGRVGGDLICQKMTINGSGSVHGNVRAADHFTINGSGRVTGSITESGKVSMHGSGKVEGSVRCRSFFSAGSAHVDGDCEGEDVTVEGAITVGGLVNGERVQFKLNGHSKVGSIGGTEIVVEEKPGGRCGGTVIKFLGFEIYNSKNGEKHAGDMEADTIEGDVITLVNTRANRVSGRIVKIGAGCTIGKLEYTESVEIDRENSTVEEEIKG